MVVRPSGAGPLSWPPASAGCHGCHQLLHQREWMEEPPLCRGEKFFAPTQWLHFRSGDKQTASALKGRHTKARGAVPRFNI